MEPKQGSCDKIEGRSDSVLRRFYVIRSNSAENVLESKKISEWATTQKATPALTNLSMSPVPVYLFFTIGVHGEYCGMAQLMSGLKRRRKWADGKYWGPSFAIEWKCKDKNIPIPLSIKNYRDMTEIDYDIGNKVMSKFEGTYTPQMKENVHVGHTPEKRKTVAPDHTQRKIAEFFTKRKTSEPEQQNATPPKKCHPSSDSNSTNTSSNAG